MFTTWSNLEQESFKIFSQVGIEWAFLIQEWILRGSAAQTPEAFPFSYL
jgi:hypothetical protein